VSPSERQAKALGALALASLLAVAAFLPADHPLGFPLCPLKRVTGVPCPTCGMTRAFCNAVQTHWQASLLWHPLGIPVVMACLVGAVWLGAEAFQGSRLKPQWRNRMLPPLAVLGIGGILATWVMRLCGVGPFNQL